MGLIRFTRFSLLPVRRLAEERFRGDGAAWLLAGNALHADLTPDSAGGGLFGWVLCGLGQQYGFPVPEGGAGRLTAALVERLRAARRPARVRRAGRARADPRGTCRGGAHERRRRDLGRQGGARQYGRAGALPRARRRRAPARRPRRGPALVPVRQLDGEGRLVARRADPLDRRGRPPRRHDPRRGQHGRAHPHDRPAFARPDPRSAVPRHGPVLDGRPHASAGGQGDGLGLHARAPTAQRRRRRRRAHRLLGRARDGDLRRAHRGRDRAPGTRLRRADPRAPRVHAARSSRRRTRTSSAARSTPAPRRSTSRSSSAPPPAWRVRRRRSTGSTSAAPRPTRAAASTAQPVPMQPPRRSPTAASGSASWRARRRLPPSRAGRYAAEWRPGAPGRHRPAGLAQTVLPAWSRASRARSCVVSRSSSACSRPASWAVSRALSAACWATSLPRSTASWPVSLAFSFI